MQYKILFIEDHKSQVLGYLSILQYNKYDFNIEPTKAHSCEEAYQIIEKTHPMEGFDMVFLDRNLPPYPEKNLHYGEDIATLIQDKFPLSKIIFLTSHTEHFIIYDIYKKINPDGILIKSDFDDVELLTAFYTVFNNENYYSKSAVESIKIMINNGNILTEKDMLIVRYMSEGLKTDTIASVLNISVSSVEKRKLAIRSAFSMKEKSYEEFIFELKKNGFI